MNCVERRLKFAALMLLRLSGASNIGEIIFIHRAMKLTKGPLLAVNFDDFYRQHSFGFHAFGTISL